MPTPKRIALFLDGTWNTVNDNTNVWRLKSLCDTSGTQLSYYNTGLGTQFGEKVRGGMFGSGLDKAVIQAYEWLIEHYEPGDQLSILGFSRGAYAARSLSGFISKCGLLAAGAPISVGQLYDRYRKGVGVKTIRELVHVDTALYTLEERWMREYSQAIPIWFVGVWDTVGALGIGCCDALTRAEIMTRRCYEMSAAYSRFGVACCPDLDNQKGNGLVSRGNSRYLWRTNRQIAVLTALFEARQFCRAMRFSNSELNWKRNN